MDFTYTWQWRLSSPPERLWPFVSDTDRLNALVGLPDVHLIDDETVTPPAHVIQTRLFGQALTWEESPFEWVQPEWFRVVRRYRTGPLAETVVMLRLTPTSEGGSLLTYTVRATPANVLGYVFIPVYMGLVNRMRLERAFRLLDARAAKAEDECEAGLTEHVETASPPRLRDEALLDACARRLVDAGFDADMVARLVDHVRTAPDADVAHMHPLSLARAWGCDAQDVVRLCLYASRVGLLELHWDVICPSCHGTSLTITRLADLPPEGHCPYCRVSWKHDSEFEHAVVVTFRPHPAVREVSVSVYCFGSPQNTPHLLSQQMLAPGEERTFSLKLEEGEYRVRWPTHPEWSEVAHAFTEWQLSRPWQARVVVTDDQDNGTSTIHFVLDDALHPAEVRLRPGTVIFHITNQDVRPHLIGVERLQWRTEHVLTAARMLHLQAFRDIFPFEALHKGMRVHVSAVTVLFTDLCGSTAFYRQAGDGPAFDQVSKHFEILRRNVEQAGGAIVKTIGDAIMGAFPTPQAGVTAALGILREIAAYNATHPDWPLRLRLGLNSGPALVVTLNEQMDYFGSTVNLAAKLERTSQGNEIVLPRELADHVHPKRDGVTLVHDRVDFLGDSASRPIVRVRLVDHVVNW
ncbi:MAG: adenylate/guanylate cyclase domain-containing protein [Ardenticatenia bacterium]|nr:adenylate/guanylate cyclase domain-containing protein [Ardenticatenia bacterium]